MDFTYKPVQVYRGWWKVSALPIGVEFKFDMRKIRGHIDNLIVMYNSCHILKRISLDKYKTKYENDSEFTWTVSDTSGPYIEIHII